MVKVNIEITGSKVTALIILALTFIMEMNDKSSGIFFLALPIVGAMVLGKQYFDKNK